MRFLFAFIILIFFVNVFGNDLTNSTSKSYSYEDYSGLGGIIEGSWSIGGYDSHYTYECSGITGATDC